ncbi:hypothetical protein HPB47_018525, partial [Ixodes persulcatus]
TTRHRTRLPHQALLAPTLTTLQYRMTGTTTTGGNCYEDDEAHLWAIGARAACLATRAGSDSA